MGWKMDMSATIVMGVVMAKNRGYRDTIPPDTQERIDRDMLQFLELNTECVEFLVMYGADADIPDMLAFKVELKHMLRRAYESGRKAGYESGRKDERWVRFASSCGK